MRCLSAVPLLAVTLAAGCRRETLALPEPLDVQVAGTPERFGRGILAAHPGALLLGVSAPAHVIVVRV